MIVLITGTPGTGKTTLARALAQKLNIKCYSISELVDEEVVAGYDRERESFEIDVERLFKKISHIKSGIIEGHMAHLLPFENATVIVLRTHPEVLQERLKRKGFSERKIKENLEAEALDVCLVESLEMHRRVYEINTSNLKPDETLECALEIFRGRGEKYLPGKIDFSSYFMEDIR